MGYPRHQRARDFKVFTRTAGSITINSTTWADLPTIGTTWDATLTAQTGDVIEVGLAATFGNEATASFMDAVTIVGGVATNYFASAGGVAGQGVNGWVAEGSQFTYRGGSMFWRTLVAGDISAGTVTVRLRYRTASAVNRTVYAVSDLPLTWMVKNLGPQDPN